MHNETLIKLNFLRVSNEQPVENYALQSQMATVYKWQSVVGKTAQGFLMLPVGAAQGQHQEPQ